MIDNELLEKYGLTQEDFEINTYRHLIMDNDFKWGVSIGFDQLEIVVSCHSEKSQIKNKDKCLEMLELIIYNAMENK